MSEPNVYRNTDIRHVSSGFNLTQISTNILTKPSSNKHNPLPQTEWIDSTPLPNHHLNELWDMLFSDNIKFVTIATPTPSEWYSDISDEVCSTF